MRVGGEEMKVKSCQVETTPSKHLAMEGKRDITENDI